MIAVGSALAASASASTVIAQWNWNSTVTSNYNRPSSGTVVTGTALGYGQAGPSTPLSTILHNGASNDLGTVISGTTWNRSATINPPLLTAANRSVGVMFSVSTAGMNAGEAVQLSWSQTVGFRSSRYWQLLVSTTGTSGPFSAPVGGIGSSVVQMVKGYTSGTTSISGNASVNVSSDGVIDFRTINGNWISQAVTTTSLNPLPTPLDAGWVDDITFTLPTGQGYEDNPNFAFAIVGLWDPTITAVSGTTGLVSSFAGTNSTDLVNGYNRSVASGGSMRLDLMTVSAVPEPSTALFGAGALGLLLARRSRRK
jgi:MYXO-CTERM domain-containing protein